ncbi:hypothetical protein K9N68_14825 [Kovacikia minuta CCNUW1]|uniref:hypothetical protein n=1 Tax=Kovacikia minuta TaxID=2931930 RepID=UPI001CCDFAFF|nr:hypothetical protein [Kovacikia minuta]UBF28994.1 hypothetical protein K9N68_14825 [Kovacikia minuta CCNUW1]
MKSKKRLVDSLRRASLFPIGIITSLICVELSFVLPSRATPPAESILLAQEQNVRIATLRCGGYVIVIRTIGSAASESYSYQTRGLYLRNGTRDGETYSFYNNDYEYKVETRGGGSGTLTVLHYGERVLTKQCTWS